MGRDTSSFRRQRRLDELTLQCGVYLIPTSLENGDDFLRRVDETKLHFTAVKIFIQEVRSGEFYTGDKGWSRQADEAYAFSNSVAALNFCQQMEREQPEKQFIMRFERPDANRGLRIHEGRRAQTISSVHHSRALNTHEH